MRCAKCNRDNPSTNAFCSACGSRIMVVEKGIEAAAAPAMVQKDAESRLAVCPRCGSGNRPTMRFCKECGTAMGPVSVQPPRPAGRTAERVPTAHVAADIPIAAPTEPSSGVRLGAAICPHCRGANDSNARFCKHCGMLLQPSGPPPAVVAGPERAVRDATARRNMSGQLVVILRNGSEGRVYPIKGESTDIGSREGAIVLSDDPYLSHRHARITIKGDSFVLCDLGSVNGIYVRLREPEELNDEDTILLGQQVLRFQYVSEVERTLGPATQHGVMVFGTPEAQRFGRLVQYTTDGLHRDVYYLSREETVLGREQADIVFPDDPFLSRRHAAISLKKDKMRFTLRDLGSSNGTAIRCRGECQLRPGDQFRVGRHLFRFDLVYEKGEDVDPR